MKKYTFLSIVPDVKKWENYKSLQNYSFPHTIKFHDLVKSKYVSNTAFRKKF